LAGEDRRQGGRRGGGGVGASALLQELGFTEYEAKVYAALVAHPGVSGYEVARYSGVPRAKVYEVLEGLQARGVVLTRPEEGRTLYEPVPYETVLQRSEERVRRVCAELADALAATAVRTELPGFLSLSGRERLLGCCRDMVLAARRRLFFSGWPAEAAALAQDLLAAERRGIGVFALVYGGTSLPLQRWFTHTVTQLQQREVERSGRWLALVADHDQALIGHVTDGEAAVGMWTRNPVLVQVPAEWIKHDIYMLEFGRAARERLGGFVPPQRLAELQAMWEG
jgi:sugar-specific transcriptional regulator TrmB